jgi:hypothetical protein
LSSQRPIRTAAVVLLLSLTSCGGDGGTDVDTEPASLELAPDTLRLAAAGDTGRITATVRNAGGSTLSGVGVTFSTDDVGVATVDASSGLVTARGDGATLIDALAAPGGPKLTRSVRIEVGGSLEPAYLVGGNVGVAYNDQVGPATGAGGVFTYALTAGALPNGLTLNPQTAAITGVPATQGAHFFEVTATNGVLTLAQTYAITISTKAASAFNMWIAYNGGEDLPPANTRNALSQALARWEEIITGNLNDVTYPASGLGADDCQLVDASLLNGAFIEDVAILMAIGPIDGGGKTLARGGPCGYGRQQRPAVISGQILLDEADLLATPAYLRDVIWHEIAHALGVGTIWADSLRFSGTDSVRYYGVNGNDEWRDLGGAADGVPVEPNIEGHWHEGWFDAEIMTPSAEGPLANHPISRMTIGALRDLGWSAVLGEADAYSLPFCSPACTVPARAAGPETISDVVRDRLLPLPPTR